jgi:hypothetical protein
MKAEQIMASLLEEMRTNQVNMYADLKEITEYLRTNHETRPRHS